jgi:hypothetical protein
MVTIISTASDHPEILLALPIQGQVGRGSLPSLYAECMDNYEEDFAKLAFLSYNNGTPIPPHDIEPIWATTSASFSRWRSSHF